MNINIVKTHPDAVIPQYPITGAACFDLVSVTAAVIPAGKSEVFDTGLHFEIPDGHVMIIHSRSGHGFNHDIRLVNSAGVVDSDYRGEVSIKLRNDGSELFVVGAGDRIAQAMVIPVTTVSFTVCDKLSDTARGAGGFGSTSRTNADLKVGQRVRLSADHKWSGGWGNPLNTDGIIDSIDDEGWPSVKWANGTFNSYRPEDSDLIRQ